MQSALEETKEELNNKTQLLETRDTELKVLHGKLVDSELQMKIELQRKEADWTALQEDYHRVGGHYLIQYNNSYIWFASFIVFSM